MRENRIYISFIMSLFCLLLSLYFGNDAERMKGQVMLRFGEEVMTAEELEEITEGKEKEEMPRITLWKESEKTEICYENLGRRKEADLIDVWGDPEQVYPGRLLKGNTLIREDAEGCMLSLHLAYELFGSEEVLGKTVSCKGSEYVVRGILDLDTSVLLRENDREGFSKIEVQGRPGGGMEEIRQILSMAGKVPEEGAVIEADVVRGILRFLRLFPAGLLLALVYREMKRMCWGKESFLWALRGCVFLLCFAAVCYSWCFSDDWIPSRWSDFEFFGDLFTAQKENFRRCLKLPDAWKDLELFRRCLRAVMWMALSAVCAELGILSAARKRCRYDRISSQ